MLNIGMIGCGNMANSIAYSITKGNDIKLICFDIDVSKAEKFAKQYGASIGENERAVVESSEMVILAIKPKDIFEVLERIKDVIKDRIIVSIVAGIKIEQIKNIIGDKKIVRIMPNINIGVEEGVLGVCFSENIDGDEKETISNLFKSLGIVKAVSEKMMDAITALFGSGPAFVAHFIDSYIDAAIKLGFSKSEAYELVLELFYGTIVNMKNNMLTTYQIKDMVTSPGGTTIEGLVEFERRGLKGIIIDGIVKAYERSKNIV